MARCIPTAAALGIGLALLGLAREANAGNADAYLFSNRASMAGGAVTAITDGAASTWYNPAGLGALSRNMLNVSGSALMLRIREIPDALRTNLQSTTRNSDVRSTELFSVPTSVLVARRLGERVAVGAGMVVNAQDSFSFENTLTLTTTLPDSDLPFDYRQHLEVTAQISHYSGMIGVGWRMPQNLRMGATLVGVYRTQMGSSAYWADFEVEATDPTTQAMELVDRASSTTALGLGLVTGLQWEGDSGWNLGLTVRTPTFVVVEWRNSREITAETSVSPNDGTRTELTYDEQSPTVTSFDAGTPVRLHLGAAYEMEHGWLGAEASVQPPIEDGFQGVDTRWTWNARLGGQAEVSELFRLGAGVFTDRSTNHVPRGFGDQQVDFVGGTLGGELVTRRDLAEDENGDEFVFTTSLTFRYARGFGEFGGFETTPLDQDVANRFPSRDVTHHELSLYLGSSLQF